MSVVPENRRLAHALLTMQLASGGIQMLRITETTADVETICLRMDGTVDGNSFADVQAACSHHARNGNPLLILDMAGVDFMTEDAARKLAVLRSPRVRIVNCSPFVETLLKLF